KLYLQKRSPSLRQKIWFGIILGFTVLARIDAVFLVIVFLCFDFFYYKVRDTSKLLAPPVVAFLISSPWWIYNMMNFGNLIPTSGQSESMRPHILINVKFFFIVCSDILSTFFHLPYFHVPSWIVPMWIVGVPLIAYIVIKKEKIIAK